MNRPLAPDLTAPEPRTFAASAPLRDVLDHAGPDMQEPERLPSKFQGLREELRELSRSSLYWLASGVLGYQDLVPRIHGPMAAFCESPPARMSLLMAFRGSFKSTIATECRAVQLQLRGPCDVLIYSEAALLAEDWSRRARRAFEGSNKMMEWLFPELMYNGAKTAKWGDAYWQLPHGGTVRAAGIDTQLMGAHVDHLFMDDIFSDPKGEKTAEFADRILKFVKMSAPLLKNPGTGHRFLTGVPWWPEGDVYAYYRKLLPRNHQFFMPLLQGDRCVWSEAFPPELIAELAADPYVFASQYLLNPVSQDTAIFKKGTVRYYEERPQRDYFKVLTVDPAYSKKSYSSHTAMTLAYVDTKSIRWIEHAEKIKLDSHDTKKWILSKMSQYKPDFVGIEANGPQKILLDEIKHTVQKFPFDHPVRKISLIPIITNTDKIARWNRLASACSTGEVRIHEKLKSSLVSEMYRVVGSKSEQNDLTDAAAQQVSKELLGKRPWRLNDSSDLWLPHALREDFAVASQRSFMAA